MNARTILIPLALSVLIGCGDDQGTGPVEFGSPYSLVQTQSLPSLSADTLYVAVAYSGCSPNHDFALKYRSLIGTVEIWLVNQTPAQACDAYFQENRVFGLPDMIRNSQKVILLGPQGKRLDLR